MLKSQPKYSSGVSTSPGSSSSTMASASSATNLAGLCHESVMGIVDPTSIAAVTAGTSEFIAYSTATNFIGAFGRPTVTSSLPRQLSDESDSVAEGAESQLDASSFSGTTSNVKFSGFHCEQIDDREKYLTAKYPNHQVNSYSY